jgi:hypothetical protein
VIRRAGLAERGNRCTVILTLAAAFVADVPVTAILWWSMGQIPASLLRWMPVGEGIPGFLSMVALPALLASALCFTLAVRAARRQSGA